MQRALSSRAPYLCADVVELGLGAADVIEIENMGALKGGLVGVDCV